MGSVDISEFADVTGRDIADTRIIIVSNMLTSFFICYSPPRKESLPALKSAYRFPAIIARDANTSFLQQHI